MSGIRVFKGLTVWSVAALLLAGCAPVSPPVEKPPPVGPPAGFPEQAYRQAAAEGAQVYRIDPERSVMVVDVLPEGPLAPTLGHAHTVSTQRLEGYVQRGEGAETGQVDLYLSVYDLEVDEPEIRASAGFESELTQEDIRGTRRNMLVEVLEAERYPWVRLRAEPLASRDGDVLRLAVDLTLHGQTRRLEIPVTLTGSSDTIEARGSFSLHQSEFGIEPFSALGGGLRVKDQLDFRFRLIAEALGG
ncbi:YceI family protein [Thiohalomonas denitrificans]|uniref:Polyisoprenoid-binding protein YceI n=1 Tax=Thiohalomonas denitrificans TaxID=415747 RepID=A0A1G5QY43_9GAMM|nr:YceI family protein [Thiohalomonas denitrificans]SCZ66692.1 Polyisoprenoid-binding protein YceI [Thiohalomonas denitrificans]